MKRLIIITIIALGVMSCENEKQTKEMGISQYQFTDLLDMSNNDTSIVLNATTNTKLIVGRGTILLVEPPKIDYNMLDNKELIITCVGSGVAMTLIIVFVTFRIIKRKRI